jgi:hypothetical protein
LPVKYLPTIDGYETELENAVDFGSGDEEETDMSPAIQQSQGKCSAFHQLFLYSVNFILLLGFRVLNARRKLAQVLIDSPDSSRDVKTAIKLVKWNKLSIENFSGEELKNIAKDISRVVGHFRNLGEMCNSFLESGGKAKNLSSSIHPDFPVRSLRPYFRFVQMNKPQLQEKVNAKRIKYKNVSQAQSFTF